MNPEQETPVVTGETGKWVISEEDIGSLFDEADRNSKFIEAHFEELLRQFPNRWIGVFQEEVVASSTSSKGLAKKLSALGCLQKGTATRYMDTSPPVWII